MAIEPDPLLLFCCTHTFVMVNGAKLFVSIAKYLRIERRLPNGDNGNNDAVHIATCRWVKIAATVVVYALRKRIDLNIFNFCFRFFFCFLFCEINGFQTEIDQNVQFQFDMPFVYGFEWGKRYSTNRANPPCSPENRKKTQISVDGSRISKVIFLFSLSPN